MTLTENPQLGAAQIMYSDVMNQLSDIDEALDSTVDAKSAGKRALRNRLMEQFTESWTPAVTATIEHLNSVEMSERVAMFSAFIQNLNKAFEEDSNKFLEAQVEANKTDAPEQPTFTEEQIAEMQAKRSELYKAAKSTRELALLFGGTEDLFPMPKKRTGTRGRRGKRAISLYAWSLNGEALSTENNNLAYVAEKYGYDTAAVLRNAIREALGLKDLKDPPPQITFVLPEGSVLSGVRDLSEEADTSTDDDEDDEDENGEDDED
jgi:hypothetical protein